MNKFVKVPTALVEDTISHAALLLDGCSVIEQCMHCSINSGTMFLEDHVIFFVLDGAIKLSYGKQSYIVNKNEMILLKKATSVRYEKAGDTDNDFIYDVQMYCLKDVLIKEFLTTNNIKMPAAEGEVKTTVNPMDECLVAFAHSLKPYFNAPAEVNPALLKLKIMELLFYISDCSQNVFRQILQLRQPVRGDIRHVVEQNYASPVTIPELAYLSGRSLSSFKRDFQDIYNTSPAQWIRTKRLEKALDMLNNTPMTIADICYSIGFENPSHFSRIFKEHYGYAPTQYRQ